MGASLEFLVFFCLSSMRRGKHEQESSMPRGQFHSCPGGAALSGGHSMPGGAACLGKQHAGGSSRKRLYILHSLSSNSCKGALYSRCRALLLNAAPPGIQIPLPTRHAAPWVCCSPCACCSLLGMLLPLRMLFPSRHADAPWACCCTCGRSSIRLIFFEAG